MWIEWFQAWCIGMLVISRVDGNVTFGTVGLDRRCDKFTREK